MYNIHMYVYYAYKCLYVYIDGDGLKTTDQTQIHPKMIQQKTMSTKLSRQVIVCSCTGYSIVAVIGKQTMLFWVPFPPVPVVVCFAMSCYRQCLRKPADLFHYGRSFGSPKDEVRSKLSPLIITTRQSH